MWRKATEHRMARSEGVAIKNPINYNQVFRAIDNQKISTHSLVSKILKMVLNIS